MTPCNSHYDKDCHLSIDDISIDSKDNLQLLRVTPKPSKTDSFQSGIELYLGVMGATICPLKGFFYTLFYGATTTDLSSLRKIWDISYANTNSLLDSLLTKLWVNIQKHNTHSFRIGAATTARQANIPDALIQMMGRWKSNGYPNSHNQVGQALQMSHH